MTSQTLILDSKAQSLNSASKASVCLATPTRLPYQESHQVELLHLQADIEALLEQLQSLKQQRLTADTPVEQQSTEVPALV